MPHETDIEELVTESVRNLASARLLLGGISEASNQFLTATSILRVSKLGYWERLIQYELLRASYRRKSLNLWVTKKPHGPWINLFNRDGFQREKALNAIAQGAPKRLLAFYYAETTQ